jgi:hypothetical protein
MRTARFGFPFCLPLAASFVCDDPALAVLVIARALALLPELVKSHAANLLRRAKVSNGVAGLERWLKLHPIRSVFRGHERMGIVERSA